MDIGDARTKKLLWMGDASDTLSDKPEKNEKKIKSALEKMFKTFLAPVKKYQGRQIGKLGPNAPAS